MKDFRRRRCKDQHSHTLRHEKKVLMSPEVDCALKQVPTARLEDCREVQLGPRLHYHAPVTINQNYLSGNSKATNTNKYQLLVQKCERSKILVILFLVVIFETVCIVVLLNYIPAAHNECPQLPDAKKRLGHLEEMVEYLLNNREDRIKYANFSSLPQVMKFNHSAIVKCFLDTGIDVNLYYGSETLLHFAAKFNLLTSVKVLTVKGADVVSRTRDTHGFTGLHIAAQHRHLQVAKWLLGHGTPVDILSSLGLTPLAKAAEYGNECMVELLINYGATINQKLGMSTTPLHGASKGGYMNVIERLLEAGADINSRMASSRKTPLHCAAEHCRASVVNMLLKKGADPDIKDVRGCTPVDLALENNCTNVVSLLQGFRS